MGTERSRTTGGSGERAQAAVSRAYALLVAGFALWVAACSFEERLTDLYADDWLNLAARAEHPWLRWLFLHHNGHLIPATRLLLHWDYAHLSGKGGLPVAVSFLAAGGALALLWAALRRAGTEDAPVRSSVTSFFAFGLLWSGLYYGFLWGFSVHANLTTLCLAGVLLGAVRRAADGPGAGGPRPAALALASALLASLSSATGVGAWVALAAIALVARFPARLLAAIALGGVVSGVLLGAGSSPFGSAAEVVGLSLAEPARLLGFVPAFIGIPAAWAAEGWLDLSAPVRDRVGLMAGVAGLLGLGFHTLRCLRSAPVREPLALVGLGLMAYGATAAALTALGRASFLAGAAFPRFTPFAMVFWMGATAALASSGAARRAVPLLLPAVSIAMLPALSGRLEAHRETRRATAELSLMVLAGVRDEALLRPLSHGAVEVTPLLPGLERDARGPFADPRRAWLGRPLPGAGPEASCPGRIQRWQRIPPGGRAGVRIEGVALDSRDAREGASIVVTDGAGTVRGLGELLPTTGSGPTLWRAFLGPRATSRQAGPFEVWRVDSDGGRCRVARRGAEARRAR